MNLASAALIFYILPQTADEITTVRALNTNPSVSEGNLLFGPHPSVGQLVLVSLPMVAGEVLVDHVLAKNHSKAVWPYRILVAGAHIFLAVHNGKAIR